jgi:pre-rRNA-processing protein TSR3
MSAPANPPLATDATIVTPPTVILVHPRERRSKCSVEPLRDRSGYLFVRWPDPVPVSLEGYVRLGLGGPLLSAADCNSGLLLLDGTWRLVANMVSHCRDLPIRSLPPIQTAYPRRSILHQDPTGGLSTIEALYAAYRILGRNTEGLLDRYHWRHEFLRMNGWSEEQQGISVE